MPKVVKERVLSIPEVEEILESKQSRGDLSSIEMTTLEYVRKFRRVSAENARNALRELVGMGLPENVSVQLVNIMPTTLDEIRVILAPHLKTLSTEDVQKIKEILDRYRG